MCSKSPYIQAFWAWFGLDSSNIGWDRGISKLWPCDERFPYISYINGNKGKSKTGLTRPYKTGLMGGNTILGKGKGYYFKTLFKILDGETILGCDLFNF